MDRREFLGVLGATAVTAFVPRLALAAGGYENLLILVELKGGNDGLNTVVPYADGEYYALRPRIAVARDQVLQLDERTGLHPALAPLMALWEGHELAIAQSVGYPAPNLSHFRSIEIWDTASNSNEYLTDGWLTRAFAAMPTPEHFAADGVVVGGPELGPFAGGRTRAIVLADPGQFVQRAKLAVPSGQTKKPALAHILKVEQDIVHAAAKLDTDHVFRTEFPRSAFGNAVRTAAQVVASRAGVAAIRISLNGFDTHSNQQGTHARLLGELATGLVALKSALAEIDRWDSTLIMTYAEFGRRPRDNESGGTDHGSASAHFMVGGRVRSGFYGPPPRLDRLDGDGNPPVVLDFRELYATVLEHWWGVRSQDVLGGHFGTANLLKA